MLFLKYALQAVAAILALLLSATFTGPQLGKYPWLQWIHDNRPIVLIATALALIGAFAIQGIHEHLHDLETRAFPSPRGFIYYAGTSEGLKKELAEAAVAAAEAAQTHFQNGEKALADYRYTEARSAFAQSIEALPSGHAFLSLGIADTGLSELIKAKEAFSRGLQIVKERRLTDLTIAFLLNLAQTENDLGNPQGAFALAQQALTTPGTNKSPEIRGRALNTLAAIQMRLGHLPAARTALEEVATARVVTPLTRAVARNGLILLSILEGKIGNVEAAADEALRDSAITPPLRANILVNLAWALDLRGKLPEALARNQEALSIFISLHNSVGIALVRRGIGRGHMVAGRYADALESYEAARALLHDLGYIAEEATLNDDIGLVYATQGRSQEALEAHLVARNLHEQAGSPVGMAYNRFSLGLIAHQKKNYQEAKEYYDESLALHRQVGNRVGMAQALCNLGSLYVDLKQAVPAEKALRESLALAQETGAVLDEARSLGNLGSLYVQTARVAEGLQLLRQAREIYRTGGGPANAGFKIIDENIRQIEHKMMPTP